MTCSKSFAITIDSSGNPLAYWTFSNANVNAETDSESGETLTAVPGAGTIVSVAGRVGLGLAFTDFAYMQQQSPVLAYTGNGFAIAFWVFYPTPTGNDPQVTATFQWNLSGGGDFMSMAFSHGATAGVIELDLFLNGNPADTLDIADLLAFDTWHFIAIGYDPTTGKLSGSVNGGAVTDSGGSNVIAVSADPLSYLLLGGSENVRLDEVGVFPHVLSAAQISYLFNGGAGRTYPLSLP